MPKLIINNSFSELKGFSSHKLLEIAKVLTYTDEQAIQELNSAQVRLRIARYNRKSKLAWFLQKQISELTERLEVCLLEGTKFPTGLLYLVVDCLEAQGLEVEDLRKVPEKLLFLNWPSLYKLRYYQEDMVKLAIERHRGVFESAVGSGKSLVLAKIIEELGVRTLIITPSTDLKEQFYDFLVTLYGNKVEKISKTSPKKSTLKPIRVANIQTLAALHKKKQLKPIVKDIDLIILDEAHHIAANSYTKLLKDLEHVYYRFGTSGTFLRADSKVLNMYGVLSDVLYRYPAKKAIAEGFLTPLEVKIHTLPGKASRTYQKEYNNNYCNNDYLLGKIAEILEVEISKDDQVLILVKQKDAAGKIIHEFLNEIGYENEYVSGNDTKDKVKQVLKDFNEKKIKILIGSGILGEGIDIKATSHLILATGGKSEVAVTQALGRAVRLFPGKEKAILHDFRFVGTKYLEKHLVDRINIYEKNFAAEIELIEGEE